MSTQNGDRLLKIPFKLKIWVPTIAACAICAQTNAQIDTAKFDNSLVRIECVDPDTRRLVTSGSGVIISEDGHILTAKHVIDRPRSKVNDKNLTCLGSIGLTGTFPAKILIRAKRVPGNYDAALLRFQNGSAKKFEPVKYSIAKQGDEILVFGVPGDDRTRGFSFVTGSVSSLGHDDDGMLRTNAMTSRGMSGGPVFNARTGALVGIVAGANYTRGTGAPTAYKVLSTEVIANDLYLLPIDTSPTTMKNTSGGIACSKSWQDIDQAEQSELRLASLLKVFEEAESECGAKQAARSKILRDEEVFGKIFDRYEAYLSDETSLYNYHNLIIEYSSKEIRDRHLKYSARLCDAGDGDACIFSGIAHADGSAWFIGFDRKLVPELDLGFTNDMPTAFSYLKRACHLDALLGCTLAGSFSYKTNFKAAGSLSKVEAIALLSKACEMGERNGCTNLGLAAGSGIIDLNDINPNLRDRAIKFGCKENVSDVEWSQCSN